jgi:outer membrane biosynthesis protein TonB
MFGPESMTTSEFIIGHSADDALERKQEVRKIFWALLAALLVHLVVAYSIAISGGLFSSHSVMEEDKPIELTFVDLNKAPAETKKNTMFMETPDSKKSVEPPPEKTFESNANSRAASEQPVTGDAPLPSQQGKDRPAVDLDTHQYSLANQGAQPQPSIKPEPSAQPSTTPTPQPTAAPEQFAMLRATPTPSPESRPSSTPQQQASSYQAYKEQTRQSGRITNRGISAVNAVGTPLGRYKKLLLDGVGSRWYHYISQRGDLASIGTAHLVFSIDRSGHVKNLKVIENTSNEAFANVCLQSIMEVQLPPIPEEVVNSLPSEGLEEDITFTMFAN